MLVQFAGSELPRSIMKKHKALFDEGVCRYCGILSPQDAYRLVSKSDFALQFNADIVPYLVSTKIFEYAGSGVPTISVNYGGDIENLIRTYDLGVSVNLNNLNAAEMLDVIQHKKTKFSLDISEFSYVKLAQRYSQLIESEVHKRKTAEFTNDESTI